MSARTLFRAIALAAAITLLCNAPARAESWGGADKQLHLVGGMAVAAAVTAATGNEWKGFLASAALGLAKEAHDSTGRGHVSGKDALVTALGALIGAKATGWALTPSGFTFTRRINIF